MLRGGPDTQPLTRPTYPAASPKRSLNFLSPGDDRDLRSGLCALAGIPIHQIEAPIREVVNAIV
ncbi:MAG: hypothetical protein OSB10_07685, partial [Planctomycetota bacterium]|nr:hypothetical protein [Planctomycetota bacterium]